MTITVIGRNFAPVARNVEFTVREPSDDFSTNFNPTRNDSDPEGDFLTTISIGGLAENEFSSFETDGGRATPIGNLGNGIFFELPSDNPHLFESMFAGETDSITLDYTIEDKHGLRDSATVTLVITGDNDAPTFEAASLTVFEDGGTIALKLAPFGDDIDSDDNGDTLRYEIVGQPSEGSASIIGSSLIFDPQDGFQDLGIGESRNVTIDILVTDRHGATATNTVTVTVEGRNDAPVAPDRVFDISEPEVVIGADDIDSDDTGDDLVFSISRASEVGNAEITDNERLSIFSAEGFDYLSAGETFDISFDIAATDNHGATSVATVTYVVAGRNDLPIAVADALTIQEGSSGMLDLTANDIEIDENDTIKIVEAADGLPIGALATIESDAGRVGQITVTTTTVFFNTGTEFDDLVDGETDTITLDYTIADDSGARSASTVTIAIEGSGSATDSEPPVVDPLVRDFDDFATAETVVGTSAGDALIFGDEAMSGQLGAPLVIETGDGADTIGFGARAALGTHGAAEPAIQVDAGAGDDNVSFGENAGFNGRIQLEGGTGADTFVFVTGAGNGQLLVDLGDDASADSLIFEGTVFGATVFNYDAGTDARIDVADVGDWNVVEGPANTTLQGAEGAITLVGVTGFGEMADTFLF